MQKYTSQQYEDIFLKLPQEIRNAISSYSTTEHINIIGKKHDLQIDQIGDLVDLTLDVMMGIVSTKDFVKEIESELKISTLESSTVARNIDENVLKPIKEIMVHLYAGRAPYKPSSSLVQYYDEDEEHPGLKKDVLLKEIEEPSEAIVKKETATQLVSKLVSESVSEEINNKVSKIVSLSGGEEKGNTIPNQLEIYHEELNGKASKLVSLPARDLPSEAWQAGELDGKEIKNEPPHQLTNSQPKNLAASDLLNKIAGIKLSKTFVMPKAGGEEKVGKLVSPPARDLPSEAWQAGELDGKEVNQSVGKLVSKQVSQEVKIESPNKLTSSPANNLPPTIDPYREKI